MTPDIAKHIDAHLRKAERKHPQFCEGLTCDDVSEDIYLTYEIGCKRIADIEPTAENLLREEEAELLTAISRREWRHARSEVYDAIAVLLRIDRELVGKIDGGSRI